MVFHRWRSDIVTASRVSNLLSTLDAFVMNLALVLEPLLYLYPCCTLHFTSVFWHDANCFWWYIYVTKHMLIRQNMIYTYLCCYDIHTTAKKLDTLDMILVLVDYILLLRPFVSSFLLSVVSVYDAAFFWWWYDVNKMFKYDVSIPDAT